ncbi:hypothetical protein MSP8887_04286 [Marinomonas spartinae]|uniref:Uncharacterized protein n=1 Tax=Marinomonas spartinae TaxID=1792290 RepID=A0A1A8T470_9GAMM|nr:hypothetical protein [Marinomonas spartinae]SBS26718.1 hypothetical protein MSP8886_00684 [Marinomonas spartinae]SBS40281.1 hypothetical protein MSP8887_04286 [Marinomonas spartinae]
MLQKIALCLFVGCFVHLAWADQEVKKAESKNHTSAKTAVVKKAELAKKTDVAKKTVVKSKSKALTKDSMKTVFELERSVAILQVSSASLDDVQDLQKQIDKLKHHFAITSSIIDRMNLLSVVIVLLFIVILALGWYIRKLSKRLSLYSSTPFSVNEKTVKEQGDNNG